MDRKTAVGDLSDEDMARLLMAAAADEHLGHIVRCGTEQEVRDLMARLQHRDG